MNLCPRASVLECGDGVFGVAALERIGGTGAELQSLARCQSQSGDFADSVTAVHNLAARWRFMKSCHDPRSTQDAVTGMRRMVFSRSGGTRRGSER